MYNKTILVFGHAYGLQALKEVLKKDFDGEEEMQAETLLYKNLWLETEAALCSVSYRARFNRMKIEMEKCKTHKAKDVTESTKSVEKLLNSKVSPDSNVTHKATPEAKDIPLSDNNLQDSPISSLSALVDDVEATALSRLHILKCRDKNSNSVSTEGQRLTEVAGTGFTSKRNHGQFIGDLTEGSSLDVYVGPYSQYFSGNNSKVDSKVSSDLNATHKATPEAKDIPLSDNSLQDSPISISTTHLDDIEASALARFHILKCRDGNSNSVSTEGRQLVEVGGTGFTGKRNPGRFIGDLTEGSSLDVFVGPYSQYFSGNNSKVDGCGSYTIPRDHETMKDFHVCATDDQVIQSCRKNGLGNRFPSGWCDSSSSEWEHVL